MKTLISLILIAVVSGPAMAQTVDLGLAQFANEESPIMMAVDASFAVRNLDKPYVLFVLYMASRNKLQEATVGRDGVSMVYQGQEYKMPSVKELRANYRAQIRDYDFYSHLGKEGIIGSWVRYYQFPGGTEFFPLPTIDSPTASDYGSMFNYTGFVTPIYFKNPGFKKGDSFLLKVRDKDNPELVGEVTVVLK
jgi:hypothetical protein